MRDPGNPRGNDPDDRRSIDRDSSSPDDLVGALAALLRGLCLVAFFVVLVIGMYYAIQVFTQVGRVITDPGIARDSVDAIAEMIDAEKLTWNLGQDPIEPGRLIAYLLLFVWYLIWFWIPMALIHAAGKIILGSLPDRDKKKKTRNQPN